MKVINSTTNPSTEVLKLPTVSYLCKGTKLIAGILLVSLGLEAIRMMKEEDVCRFTELKGKHNRDGQTIARGQIWS